MKIRVVEVTGYRSIRNRLLLHLDDHVTVILGANDHGKSNLLHALLHLNGDKPFTEEDRNWDAESAELSPDVSFTIEFDAAEQASLLTNYTAWNQLRQARERSENLAKALQQARGKLERAEAAPTSGPADPNVAADEPPADAAPDEALTEPRPIAVDPVAVELARNVANLEHAVNVAEHVLMQLEAEQAGQAFDLEGEITAATATAASLSAEQVTARDAATKAQAEVDTLRSEAPDAQETKTAASRAKQASGAAAQARDAARAAQAKAERLESIRDSLDHADTLPDDLRQFIDAAALSGPDSAEIPERIVLRRQGVGGPLTIVDSGTLDAVGLQHIVLDMLPRIELILPQERLADDADPNSLDEDDHEFMRGIFRYAGLEPDQWSKIFEQNDQSTKQLDEATNRLNETLQAAWSQGRELSFRLRHRGDRIDLQIHDPAVLGRYVRMSKRSAGFTHFFALKTVLYARECASRASSYVWLFDEPGIYLHPEGQHDLVQVLEALSASNQIVYSTHSVFMLNKNFPARHRLIHKSGAGTEIDGKPFVGRWRSAIEALGLALPGTILFAAHVLLVEGDSDPMIMQVDLQRLIQLGKLDFDINGLSIMSTGEARNADALVRLLRESAHGPKLAMLFDGDDGGKARRKVVEKTLKIHNVPVVEMPRGTTIEDNLLYPELYRDAAIDYLQALAVDLGVDRDKVAEHMSSTYPHQNSGPKSEPVNTAEWYRTEGRNCLELDSPPSSIGPARIYADRVLALGDSDDPPGLKRALRLASQIAQHLMLESRTAQSGQIVQDA